MKTIFIAVALSISFVFGETVSLSGRVTKAGSPTAPIAGAEVYLSNHPSVLCLTGAQGDFNLTGSTAIRSGQDRVSLPSPNTISFNKNRITIVCKNRQSLKIEIVNCRGERIFAQDYNLIAGQNSIALNNKLQAHGMYIVRVRINNNNYTLTFISTDAGQLGNITTITSAQGLGKKQANGMDSLVVSAKGYKLAKTELDGYIAQNIAVAVQPFTPMGMKLIPAKDSSFLMGAVGGWQDEVPAHKVSFSRNFHMDSTEVTQGDFTSVMQNSYATFTVPPWGYYGKSDKEAAYFIDWYDAVLYCNAKSKRDGLDTIYSYTEIEGNPGNFPILKGATIDYQKNGYRLPTEAEWEYACRAGTKTDWYFDTAKAGDNAWYDANSKEQIYPVAMKLPNNFGLYDMSGNIWEWVNDWHGDYPDAPQIDPIGPDSGTEKIWRGGSWGSNLIILRSAFRGYNDPSLALSDNGFRCVLSSSN